MIAISFYIRYLNKNFSVELPTVAFPSYTLSGRQISSDLIISSAIRSDEYAQIVSTPMIGAELRPELEFKKDFQLIIDTFNKMSCPVSISMFKQVVLRVCTNHTNQYGHIWIADALMYVDCAIFALQTINRWNEYRCKTAYQEIADSTIYAIGDKLKRPSLF